MSEFPYRLCAIDLDDTLLDSQQQISSRNLRAVHTLMERGVIVVLASGRMHEAALPFARKIGLETPIISYNGAMVRPPESKEAWLEEHVPGDIVTTVMDYAQEVSLQLNLYREGCIRSASYTKWLELYHTRTRAPVQIVPDFYNVYRGLSSTKLVIVDSPERTDNLYPVFKEMLGERVYLTKTTDEYLEMMPPDANKGAALAFVAERFGISQEQTLAFGDAMNDLPLLKWAGKGLAMQNAKPALKEAADGVIGHHNEDAVGIALEDIFGF